MMSCKKATELMSQSQDRELSIKERSLLKLHLTMCNGCRNYRKQLDFIRSAFTKINKD